MYSNSKFPICNLIVTKIVNMNLYLRNHMCTACVVLCCETLATGNLIGLPMYAQSTEISLCYGSVYVSSREVL